MNEPEDDAREVILKAMRGELSKRDMALIGLGRDTKRAITRLIEASPVSEGAILDIADMCYRDGAVSTSSPADSPEILLLRQVIKHLQTALDELNAPSVPAICMVCRKEHEPGESIKFVDNEHQDVELFPGHEYIIITKTSMQRYPRKWRMGFMGAYGNELQFSARGPGGTHDNQYGGTQTVPLNIIQAAREVKRDDKRRYVGKPVK
jgi:hypothetical protein